MKKAEILSILSTNSDAVELYTINEEFTRVKFLMKSLSQRKGVQEDAVSTIMESFRKVRIGSVISHYIKLQQEKQGVVVSDKDKTIYNQLIKKVNNYITEVVSLADRLLSACLSVVSNLTSSRMSEKNREEAVEKAQNVLSAIMEKMEYSRIREIYIPLYTVINDIKTGASEASESTQNTEIETSSNAEKKDGEEAQIESEKALNEMMQHIELNSSINGNRIARTA